MSSEGGKGSYGACSSSILSSLSSSSADSHSVCGEKSRSCASKLFAFFLSRLARGDDMPSLVRYIYAQLHQMHQQKQDHIQKLPMSYQPKKLFPQGCEKEDNVGLEVSTEVVAEKSAITTTDCTCLPLRRLAKTALLFSVESDEAGAEVTRLIYHPEMAPIVRHIHQNNVDDFVRLPEKVEFMLSDSVAVSCGRKLSREGRWEEAIRMLSDVTVSPKVLGAAMELFSSAGRWEMVLRCFGEISPVAWTEVEVAAALRSIYRASQGRLTQGTTEERKQKRRAEDSILGSSAPSWWSLAIRVLGLAHTADVHITTPSPINDALAVLTMCRENWQMACRVVECFMVGGRNPEGGSKDKGDGFGSVSPNKVVSPNMVSVYHMCRILRQQWYLALHYASLMVQQGDLLLADDREATQKLLQACIRGNRWVEALRTLQQYLVYSKPEDLVVPQDHIAVDIFLDLFRMLNKCQKGSLASRLLYQKQLSKHFGADATGRAFNVMLRSTNTAGESLSWTRVMKAKGIKVENESYEHLLLQSSREGEWRQALWFLDKLLDDPVRRYFYLPSAKVHDAVQYALERAPPPGASWEVSVRLFSRMCDLHVPISEVAFQSAVKKCFSHGMAERAQAIFTYMIHYGVRR